MPSPGVHVEKSGAAIQEMFSRIAPRYDLLNRLLSGSLDVLWRRRAAAALQLGPGSRVLDLCSGTGDQALAIRRRHRARIAAADFCLPMLALARRKFSLTGDPRPANLASDALAIPFADASFDAGTVSFGLRNVADLDRALSEICRVLKPRGQAVFLEFALPRSRVFKAIYLFYFRRILPVIGRLFSHQPSAYQYLPASVSSFPQRECFLAAMTRAGFDEVAWEEISLGIVCLYRGRKKHSAYPAAAERPQAH